MHLSEVVRALRSKNAGPVTLVIDVLFRDAECYGRYADSPSFSIQALSRVLGVEPKWISVSKAPQAWGLKITLPRPIVSASVGDPDVYGCQYYVALADFELP